MPSCSKTGRPSEGIYKTLKEICAALNIPYGTFTENGFVPHDLRHNFTTDIIRVTDLETAKQMTGHSGDHIQTYLHTDEGRMRDAVRRREGRDLTDELTALYNEVKNGRIELRLFLECVESFDKKRLESGRCRIKILIRYLTIFVLLDLSARYVSHPFRQYNF